jgi:hypothetical protein
MRSTIPRVLASSANSRGVHWLMGRPESPGGSQAMAMSRHNCSGVKVAGAPGRGASASTPRMTVASARSSPSPPSASAASSTSVAAAHRPRQVRTVSSVTPTARPTCSLFAPVAAAKITVARRTCCWVLVSRRTIPSTTRRWRALRAMACGCGSGTSSPS